MKWVSLGGEAKKNRTNSTAEVEKKGRWIERR